MLRFPWLLAMALVIVRTETWIDDIDEGDKMKIKQAATEAGLGSHEFNISQMLRTGESDGQDAKPAEGNTQISCYTCSDCKDLLMKTPVTLCPHSEDIERMHTCITYVEKYNFLDKPWYVRGCSTKLGSCDEIKQMHEGMKDHKLGLKQCYECVGELCNGVSIPHSFSLLFLVFSPILLKLAML